MNDLYLLKLGQKVWEAATSEFKGESIQIPFSLEDGGVFTVKVTPPYYVDTRLSLKDGVSIERRSGRKQQDGSIKWGEWS